MKGSLEISLYLCNQLIDLLEQDYQKLLESLSGEIYEEYKLMILDEIERVVDLKQKIKRILQLI